MNAATKIILVLAVLAGAAIAYVMFTDGDGQDPPMPFVETPVENDGAEPRDPDIERASEPAVAEPARDVNRARTEIPAAGENAADMPQGVTGQVVDTYGAPIAGAEVSLRKIVPGGIFGPMLRKQQGIGNAPLGVAHSDASGTFTLGLRTIEPAPLEMWVTSDAGIDKNVKGVEVKTGEWTDVGPIRLERGCVLFGRVTDETTGAPVAGATVYANNPIVTGIDPAPGRDLGVPMVTDNNGDYRFKNIAAGAVQVQVHAEGYARMSDHAIRVTTEEPTQRDFELPVGMQINGVVTDAEGNGIAGADVSAVCLSTQTPMKVDVRADGNGFFVVEGLVDAPFQLNATADGFLRATVQPVQAGETDQHIVLETQGGARLRVVGSDGRALKSYGVMMLRYFEKNDSYGAAHDIPMKQVRARDLDGDGSYEVQGLNPGDYAFEIYADKFAKTRSEPFKVTSGAATETVTVTMKNGGVLEGVVLGPDGQPLAGVEVETVPPNLVQVPFLQDLQHLMTTDITRQTTKTNARGHYRLTTLAPATYQLKFSHPDSYVKFVRDVVVGDEQTTQVESVQLERGTRVWGTVRVDGRPEAGVKISITAAPAQNNLQPGQVPQIAMIGFSAEAVSNERGEFEFARRVPPGRYTLRAGRTQGNPLLIMLDYKKTEQEITFSNEDSFEYSPNIISN